MMHQVVSAWMRLVALFSRRRIARDVDAEIAFHVAMRREQLERDGTPPADADRLARRQFGNVTRLREDTREMWTFPSLESVVQDVRFALRMLRRNRGFTAVAILTLALGIGANTAIFSVIDHVLLSPLAFEEPDRIVSLWTVPTGDPTRRSQVSVPDFRDWVSQSTSFEAVGVPEPKRQSDRTRYAGAHSLCRCLP